jgi:hypothetical protein
MAEAIVLCIEGAPVVDSIDIVEVLVVVESIDTDFAAMEDREDIVEDRVAEVDKSDTWYRAVVVALDRYYMADRVGKAGMQDKADKGHTVWAKEEEMVFYISVVDRVLDEWVKVRNYNYHNSLHSILAYTYHY